MSKWIELETDASTGKPYLWKCDECGEEVETRWNYCPECGDPKTSKGKNINTLVKALEAEHRKLREMQAAQPHTYRGVTLNDVMMYFDSLEGNEDAWTEFCSCLECRGWGLYHMQSATDKNVGTNDTISRQGAIDALRTCYDTETITMDNGDEYINYGDAVGEIEQLPPAQPETATVTIGRTKGGVTMWYECDACGEPVDQKDWLLQKLRKEAET